MSKTNRFERQKDSFCLGFVLASFILCYASVVPQMHFRCFFVASLIVLRIPNESRTNPERRMNERLTKDERGPNEDRTRTEREPNEDRTRTEREPIENNNIV